ncbi:uncharacterized protein N7529_003178 [Penicillium soppii]|uniref:uncharacterized protein n=1 Tax=Penicillium soppii TaxID=69789 RepID=UPI0025490E44|nr:uncharacterized protein N7529_003178 [Penicillium soppii]KAJ5874748.1 hypothetical protein N7529_003178 [Penicillium soppii]
MSMSGNRSLPNDFAEIYTQICEAFTHKMQCQVFALLSPSPSPDFKDLRERLSEMAEKVQQIGYLGEVGEFPVRDHKMVVKRWGMRGVKEICGFIGLDLLHIQQGLDEEWPHVTADRLVALLDALPF